MLTKQLGMLSIEGFEFALAVRSDLLNTGQSCPSELQAIWVQKAQLHESSRFLGAPAGIGGVYQATLVLHELVEIAARSGKKLSKIIRRDLHHISADFAADSKDLPQNVGHALPAIQAEQHPAHASHLRFFHQNRQIDGHGVRVGQIQIRGGV